MFSRKKKQASPVDQIELIEPNAEQVKKKAEKASSKINEPEFSWESSRLMMIERSERRAWNVAKAFGACFVLSLGAIALMMPLKSVEPYVIEVDKNTGMSEILHIANTQDIPVSEMMNKYWLSQYVLAREGYDWRTLEQEYIKVRELSLPNVFEPYASQFGNSKNSLEQQFKDNMRIRVQLNTIVVNSDYIATVRFTKQLIDNTSGMVKATNSWIATIGFEYFPDFKVPEERRIVNPFGFKVTSYRVDPEISGGR